MRLSLNSLPLRYALRLSIAATLMVALYRTIHYDHGYWAVFATLGCMFPTVGQSFLRFKQRVIGTFLGMFIGIVAAHSLGGNWIFLMVLIPILLFLSVYLKAFDYMYYMLINTIISVAFVCFLVPGDWQVAMTRMGMTLIGGVFAVIATYLILPNRASETFEHQIHQLRMALKLYYLSIAKLNKDGVSRELAFSTLRKTQANLLEIPHETWKSNPDAKKLESQLANLERVYESMILLDLELLDGHELVKLQDVYGELTEVSVKIEGLFDDPSQGKDVLLSLDDLYLRGTAVRQHYVKDLQIPLATFHEHIRMTEAIKQLSHLTRLLCQSPDQPLTEKAAI